MLLPRISLAAIVIGPLPGGSEICEKVAIAERDLCESAEQYQALKFSQQTTLDVFV